MNEIIQFISTYAPYAPSAGITCGIVYAGKTLYPDLLQPAVQAIGQSLAGCWKLALGNRIDFMNESQKKKFANKILLTADHIKDADPNKILTEVPPDIIVQLLEKLSYVESEDIANLFATLLAKSIHEDTWYQVHPRYVSIINSMAVDEAKIINYIYNIALNLDDFAIPVIWLTRSHKTKDEYIPINGRHTNIKKNVTLLFPRNEDLYFENLISLGVFDSDLSCIVSDKNAYEAILSICQNDIDTVNAQEQDAYEPIKMHRGSYVLTALGADFTQTCFRPIHRTSEK